MQCVCADTEKAEGEDRVAEAGADAAARAVEGEGG